jgi:hypothetical protein
MGPRKRVKQIQSDGAELRVPGPCSDWPFVTIMQMPLTTRLSSLVCPGHHGLACRRRTECRPKAMLTSHGCPPKLALPWLGHCAGAARIERSPGHMAWEAVIQ